jgi:hypothetical protein
MTEQRTEQWAEERKVNKARKQFQFLDSETSEDKKKPSEPLEQYSYSWYLPADHNKTPGPAPPMPPEPEEPEPAFQDAPSQQMEVPVSAPTTRYVQEHLFDKSKGILSNRLRILAVAGWSAVPAVGAAVIVLRELPNLATSLTELGAVWAGVSVGLWVLITKLGK